MSDLQRPSLALRALVTVAVGASLAACASAVMIPFGGIEEPVRAGPPAFVLGVAWVALLRWPKASPVRIRWGWLASVPFAATYAALYFLEAEAGSYRGAHALTLVERLLEGVEAVSGWGVGLLLVLAAFGLPIALAHRMARRGLEGEELGERLVAVVATLLGVATMVVVARFEMHHYYGSSSYTLYGHIVFYAAALAATALGAAAAGLASLRSARRRRFVARVEAGREPGYRIDASHGKVLVREGAASSYRVAEEDQRLFIIEQPHSPPPQNPPRAAKPLPLLKVAVVGVLLVGVLVWVATVLDEAPPRPCPPGQHLTPDGFEPGRCEPNR